MNKRQLKKRNDFGRIMYLFDHFCSIPKVALARYFEKYPKDWTKVRNMGKGNYAINSFKKDCLAQRMSVEKEKYGGIITRIRNGNFIRYFNLKCKKSRLSDVFEKRHAGIWISAELQEYNY